MTGIQWTDEVWNPTRGCSLVSEGCRNCYAMKQARRSDRPGGAYAGLTEIGPAGVRWNGRVVTVPELLDKPRHWEKPRMVFVDSMSDFFHPDLPDAFRLQAFNVMRATPRHTYQILTKRPEVMQPFMERLAWATPTQKQRAGGATGMQAYLGPPGSKPLDNVWLGVSVENQRAANLRIPLALASPAALTFVSCEPLLEGINIAQWLTHDWRPALIGEVVPRLGWVITGGESGHGARWFDPTWAVSLRDQCKATGVPFFLKQLGRRWAIDHNGRGLFCGPTNMHGSAPEHWRSGLRRCRAFPVQQEADIA